MPAGWRGENYLAIERRADARGQLFLEPQYAVILTSRADSAPAGIAAVHRSKQGCENAWKGPLIDLGLHHPRCRSLAANRAWLCCAHMAQLLLQALQLQALPADARDLGLGSLIRRFMRSAACLVRRARDWVLLFPEGDAHIRWHRMAAARLGHAC